MKPNSEDFGKHGEEYLCDGIIHAKMERVDDANIQRRIRCVKMRGTNHSPNYFTLMFQNGILQATRIRSEEHTSELQSPCNLVCRLLLEKKKYTQTISDAVVSRRRRHHGAEPALILLHALDLEVPHRLGDHFQAQPSRAESPSHHVTHLS